MNKEHLSLVALVGVIALAFAGKVGGDAALAFFAGLLIPSPVSAFRR